jgi:N-methylhydantoinase B
VFSTAGAGGQGDPLTREPERTAADVHAGLVSVQAAASEYGVIVSPDGEVDLQATERERERMRSQREDLAEFDFGPVPSMEKLGAQIAEERASFDSRLAGRSAGS